MFGDIVERNQEGRKIRRGSHGFDRSIFDDAVPEPRKDAIYRSKGALWEENTAKCLGKPRNGPVSRKKWRYQEQMK